MHFQWCFNHIGGLKSQFFPPAAGQSGPTARPKTTGIKSAIGTRKPPEYRFPPKNHPNYFGWFWWKPRDKNITGPKPWKSMTKIHGFSGCPQNLTSLRSSKTFFYWTDFKFFGFYEIIRVRTLHFCNLICVGQG